MKITPQHRDNRKRYYGPGRPRMLQPGELVIDPEDQELQAMVNRTVSQSNFLPLSGGVLTGDVTLSDSVNLILGSSSGTKIGTATSQKLSFFNNSPVVQPSSTGQTAGFTAGGGSAAKDDSTFTGGVGTKAYTTGDIVRHLKNLGLIASS